MSFKFNYRLSLLFVLAAVVAGVTVWLRQAVVRDRNIRELLAEEYVSGHPDSETTHWNTKFLNLWRRIQVIATKFKRSNCMFTR